MTSNGVFEVVISRNWWIAFSFICLFIAAVMASAPASSEPIIEMQAIQLGGNPLPESVPLYYVVAHSSKAIPFIYKHHGLDPVEFNQSSGADAESYIGAYIPSGWGAQYRFQLMKQERGRCIPGKNEMKENWVVYEIAGGDADFTTPLKLGRSDLNLPRVAEDECILIQWEVHPDPNYSPNNAHLLEVPSSAKDGLAFLPASKSVEQQAPGLDGGGISLSVSEKFGALPKELKIWAGRGAPISILHNVGAPTDDGMNWCVVLKEAEGLYRHVTKPTARQIDVGSSQFVGHPDGGTTFADAMWGMEMPLQQTGQALTTARECGGEACFVPMYSDFARSSPESSAGTLPFVFPRSVHPWDGQVKSIALEPVAPADGSHAAVERLVYSFNYRPHTNFTATMTHPHLWFHQATAVYGTPRDQPIDIYLVRTDGKTTHIDYNHMRKYEAGLTDKAWDDFCEGDGYPEKHCSKNIHNIFSCKCAFNTVPHSPSKDRIKRVVYNYGESHVAASLENADAHGDFAYLSIGAVFGVRASPGILTDAGNIFLQEPREYKTTSAPMTDGYYFNVGTLQNLNNAGVGIGPNR